MSHICLKKTLKGLFCTKFDSFTKMSALQCIVYLFCTIFSTSHVVIRLFVYFFKQLWLSTVSEMLFFIGMHNTGFLLISDLLMFLISVPTHIIFVKSTKSLLSKNGLVPFNVTVYFCSGTAKQIN